MKSMRVCATVNYLIVIVILIYSQATFSSDDDRGKALFEKRCHNCHGLPDPSKPPEGGWENRLEKMAKLARLKKSQKAEVLAFLQRHSQDESIKKVVADDQRLLTQKCTVCHTLGRIELEKFDGDTGKHILDRMQSFAGTDKITNDDLSRVLSYLQGKPGLPKPQRIKTSDPAELFRARCTACHSLERIFRRVRAEGTTDATWLHIISRMKDKAPDWITDNESEQLLDYLKSLKSGGAPAAVNP